MQLRDLPLVAVEFTYASHCLFGQDIFIQDVVISSPFRSKKMRRLMVGEGNLDIPGSFWLSGSRSSSAPLNS